MKYNWLQFTKHHFFLLSEFVRWNFFYKPLKKSENEISIEEVEFLLNKKVAVSGKNSNVKAMK